MPKLYENLTIFVTESFKIVNLKISPYFFLRETSSLAFFIILMRPTSYDHNPDVVFLLSTLLTRNTQRFFFGVIEM